MGYLSTPGLPAQTRFRLGLLLLCLLAFALRLHLLEDISWHEDEAATYELYVLRPLPYIFSDYRPNNHWLASFLGHFSGWVGHQRFLLRWPSIWFGVLAIPLIGLAGRWFLQDGQSGLLAALLLSLSAFHWQWSQQFRGYSLLLFFALLAMVLLHRALRTKDGKYRWGLLLALSLTVASHLFGVLMVIVTVTILLSELGSFLMKREQTGPLPRWVLMLAGSGLLLIGYLTWFGKTRVINLTHPLLDVSFFRLLKYQWQALGSTIPDVYQFLAGIAVAFTTQPSEGVALILFWGLALMGLTLLGYHRPRTAFFLAVWVLCPIAVVVFAEFAVAGFFVFERFLLPVLPAWFLLAAYTATAGRRRLARLEVRPMPGQMLKFLPLGLIGYLIWLNLELAGAYLIYRTGSDWRAVTTYLATHATPTDLILCQHLPHQLLPGPSPKDECVRELQYRLQPYHLRGELTVQSLETATSLNNRLAFGDQAKRSGAVWLVLWGKGVLEASSAHEAGLLYASAPLPVGGISPQISKTPPGWQLFDRFGYTLVLRADARPALVGNLEKALHDLAGFDTTSPARFDYYLRQARVLAYQGHLTAAHSALHTARDLAPFQAGVMTQVTETSRFISSLQPVAATPTHRLNIDFGIPPALHLSGLALPPTLSPGQTVPLTFFWQALSPLEADYTVFVHLRHRQGHTVAQLDFRPFDDSYPTSQWRPGQSIKETRFWTLPGDLPPDNYTLHLGLYRVESLARLPVSKDTSGENAVLLQTVRLE